MKREGPTMNPNRDTGSGLRRRSLLALAALGLVAAVAQGAAPAAPSPEVSVYLNPD